MRPRAAVLVILALLAALLTLAAACSSGSGGAAASPSDDSGAALDTSTGPVDASVDTGADAVEASAEGAADAGSDGHHLGFPPVTYGGAPLLRSPKVVTVTFQGDTMASQLQTYGQGLTQSPYWAAVIDDYCQDDGGPCMGQPGVSAPVASAAGTSYVDTATGDPTQLPDGGVPLWSVLSGGLESGALPQPDADTLYVLYFPSTTTVNLDGAPGCSGWDGYHNQMTYTPDGGAPVGVVYSVVMECQGYQLSDVTLTAAHEVVESATDGIQTASTWGWYLDMTDPNTFGWNDVGGGEVADLCDDLFGKGLDHTPEGSFTAQRIWSTSRAKLGQNPCVPVPSGEVYFNAAPEKALLVMDVGQTRTFTVTGFSDAAHAPWTLGAQDWSYDYTNPSKQYVQVSMGGATGDAGAQATIGSGQGVTVSVTLLADPTVTTLYGEADLALVSSDQPTTAASSAVRFWPMAILTTAAAADAGVTEPPPARRVPRVHRRPSRRAGR